jgi:predicted alpha/beta superfamily hydrolase
MPQNKLIHINCHMKTYGTLLLIVAFLISCQSRETTVGSDPRTDLLLIGNTDSLRSEILDETRTLWIHVPDEATGAIFGKTSYPVLYLLDGPDHFHAVTGMLKNLGDNGLVPRMVVVGIPNTDRTRDLTPTHVDEMFGDSAFVLTSGGGASFLDFMERELIPFVESKYPVTGYRTFVGHSFGGLTAVYALLSRPGLFSNYVAIDPSLWWDDWLMVHWADTLLQDPVYRGKALYVGVANTMEEGMDIDRVLTDTTPSSNHIRSILTFVGQIETGEGEGLEFGWKYYRDDDHGSVPLITEYDALRFLFPWYRLTGLELYFQEDADRTVEDLLATLNDHYAMVSEHFGYEVLPPEPEVNSLGYNFMNTGKPDMARALFELNIRNYPGSANVYDSMGDYHLSQSDTLQAIEAFKQALERGQSPFTRAKLDQLLTAGD